MPCPSELLASLHPRPHLRPRPRPSPHSRPHCSRHLHPHEHPYPMPMFLPISIAGRSRSRFPSNAHVLTDGSALSSSSASYTFRSTVVSITSLMSPIPSHPHQCAIAIALFSHLPGLSFAPTPTLWFGCPVSNSMLTSISYDRLSRHHPPAPLLPQLTQQLPAASSWVVVPVPWCSRYTNVNSSNC